MDLFAYAAQHPFDGATFDAERDGSRLHVQLDRVRKAVESGEWLTLAEISARSENAPLPSVSARLRDLRKPKFGGHQIERRYRERGVWEYRLHTGGRNDAAAI